MPNENVTDLNMGIRAERLKVEKLMKEFKLQRAITLITVTSVVAITVIGIVVVTNKLDGSLKTEAA